MPVRPVGPPRRPVYPPYRPGRGYPVRGGYGVSPWLGAGGWVALNYPGYLDTYLASDPGNAALDEVQPQFAQPDYPPDYPQQLPYDDETPVPYVDRPRSADAPAAEEAVTILFKDGRPPLQIHNYVLTQTTLYVSDQKFRDYPLDEIDLAGTIKANHDAGVVFGVPVPIR